MKNKKGFTLVEMLIVVLIIGILGAIALPRYMRAVWESRFAKMKSITSSIHKSAEVFYLANQFYPRDYNDLDVDLPIDPVLSVVSGNVYILQGESLLCNVMDNELLYCFDGPNGLVGYGVGFKYGKEWPQGAFKAFCLAKADDERSVEFCKLRNELPGITFSTTLKNGAGGPGMQIQGWAMEHLK